MTWDFFSKLLIWFFFAVVWIVLFYDLWYKERDGAVAERYAQLIRSEGFHKEKRIEIIGK